MTEHEIVTRLTLDIDMNVALMGASEPKLSVFNRNVYEKMKLTRGDQYSTAFEKRSKGGFNQNTPF